MATDKTKNYFRKTLRRIGLNLNLKIRNVIMVEVMYKTLVIVKTYPKFC